MAKAAGILVAAVSTKRAAIRISALRWLALTIRFVRFGEGTIVAACRLVFICLSPFLKDRDTCQGLASGTSACSGFMRMTESNGIAASRTFLSKPYNAA